MKFQCEKCGRSYLAGEEVRGRAFRMKCKQCGHPIVVRPEVAELAPELAPVAPDPVVSPPQPPPETPAPSAADLLRSAAAVVPPAELVRRPRFDPFDDEPAQAPANGKAHANGAAHANRAARANGAGRANAAVPAPANALARGAQSPPPPLHDEAEAAFAALDAEMSSEAPPPARPARPAREDVSATTAAGALPAEDEAKLGPVELGPVTPKRKGPPLRAAIAVLLAAGIGLFFLVRPSPRREATPPPQPAASPSAPAPKPVGARPATAPKPVEAPAPKPAEAAPAAKQPAAPPPAKLEPPRVRAGKSGPAEKHEQFHSQGEARLPRKAEPSAPPAAPPMPGLEPPRAAAAEPTAGANVMVRAHPSDPKVIAAVVRDQAKLFEACVADAAKREPQIEVAGRRVELTLTVSPAGGALYPTLDDVQLRDTQLGRCLKDAGTKLRFPAFDGPSERVRVPLTLGR